MKAYLLILTGNDLEAEDVLASNDTDAIWMAEHGIECDPRGSAWTEAFLTDENGDEIWRRHQVFRS